MLGTSRWRRSAVADYLGSRLAFHRTFALLTTSAFFQLLLYCYLRRSRGRAGMATHMWKALRQPRTARIQIQDYQITRRIAVRFFHHYILSLDSTDCFPDRLKESAIEILGTNRRNITTRWRARQACLIACFHAIH